MLYAMPGALQALGEAAEPAKASIVIAPHPHDGHRGRLAVGGSDGLELRVVYLRYLRNG